MFDYDPENDPADNHDPDPFARVEGDFTDDEDDEDDDPDSIRTVRRPSTLE